MDITEHRRLEGDTSGSRHFLLAAPDRDGAEKFPRNQGLPREIDLGDQA
ncbi:hypothetical protein [Streptosporangium sp. CA-115845]